MLNYRSLRVLPLILSISACTEATPEYQAPFSADAGLEEPSEETEQLPSLRSLAISGNEIEDFSPETTSYRHDISVLESQIYISASASSSESSVFVQGVELPSTETGMTLPVDQGVSEIEVQVVATNGSSQSYILRVTRGARAIEQSMYQKAPSPAASARLGASIAISGDTLALAAPGENQEAGAVYMYHREEGQWQLEARVQAATPSAHDFFGVQVSLSEDTLAVAQQSMDGDGTSIHLFERAESNWNFTQEIDTALPIFAIDGTTLAIGNTSEDTQGINTGVVYLYERDTYGTWTRQQDLHASNAEAGDNFGFSLALDNGQLVIGAPYEDGASERDNSGAAYVFRKLDSSWVQAAYLRAEDESYFGVNVGISDDTLVVSGQNNDGGAYVFRGSGASWTQEAVLHSSNLVEGDDFAGINSDLAIAGDLVAVSARYEDSDSTGINNSDNDDAQNSGAVYLFRREGTKWIQDSYIKASNTEAGDGFGEALALSQDTLIVGASYEDGKSDESDNSSSAAGTAYLFR